MIVKCSVDSYVYTVLAEGLGFDFCCVCAFSSYSPFSVLSQPTLPVLKVSQILKMISVTVWMFKGESGKQYLLKLCLL